MRISDWSSDVCSSDLAVVEARHMRLAPAPGRHVAAETFAQMIERHLQRAVDLDVAAFGFIRCGGVVTPGAAVGDEPLDGIDAAVQELDRKSTRLNSSH